VADTLTSEHGRGPWSTKTSEKGILLALRTSQVYVSNRGAEIVATFRLSPKKPWAIDTSYFTECRQPLYLLAMAVRPTEQRRGLGKRCFNEAIRIARAWPADALRLDAYDAAAGAGNFYVSCGCTEKGRVTYRNTPLVYYEFLLA
jgi:GNAT superfamily N-acetyltransferase